MRKRDKYQGGCDFKENGERSRLLPEKWTVPLAVLQSVSKSSDFCSQVRTVAKAGLWQLVYALLGVTQGLE